MVQAETRWIRNTETYDPKNTTLVNVLITISVEEWAVWYSKPSEKVKLWLIVLIAFMFLLLKEDDYYMLAYVGSQADKFNDAVGAMNELLTTMPKLPVNLDLAKGQVKKI